LASASNGSAISTLDWKMEIFFSFSPPADGLAEAVLEAFEPASEDGLAPLPPPELPQPAKAAVKAVASSTANIFLLLFTFYRRPFLKSCEAFAGLFYGTEVNLSTKLPDIFVK
jgi:hypothetical protein